jgi:hypothetical protein
MTLVRAPRRVVNLPYNSLGPLLKVATLRFIDLRRRRRGERLVSQLAKRFTGWVAYGCKTSSRVKMIISRLAMSSHDNGKTKPISLVGI